jgi:hypothetical protein
VGLNVLKIVWNLLIHTAHIVGVRA